MIKCNLFYVFQSCQTQRCSLSAQSEQYDPYIVVVILNTAIFTVFKTGKYDLNYIHMGL